MDEFRKVQYFTEIAFSVSGAISGLWALHATVLIGAAGWALSKKESQIGSFSIVSIIAMLIIFYGINLYSIGKLYGILNAAIEVPRDYWNKQEVSAEVKAIFRPFGQIGHLKSAWLYCAIALDIITTVIVFFIITGKTKSKIG